MAAATALIKMAAICGAVLLILLSVAGQQPAMAAAYVAGHQHQQDKGGYVLQCPSPVTSCRTNCSSACNVVSPTMCNMLCGLTPDQLLGGVDRACVNHFFTACQAACKNLCEPLPIPANNP